MRRVYVLVKDHLEQAQAVLVADDDECRQLSQIIETMIKLIDDLDVERFTPETNVIRFPIIARPIPRNQ